MFRHDARPDAIQRIIIRDYISNLASPYERDICSRHILQGEDLETIANSYNISVEDLKIDLRAALSPLKD